MARWEKYNSAWEKRKVQLTMWNQEERQQQLLQQQQEQFAIKKAREDAEKLKNYHVRQHKAVLAQAIQLEKERTRQENVPPSPRLSPRTCPPTCSLLSLLVVLCAVAG